MVPVKRAGVYVRISSDPDGTALGVERQKADCQELVRTKGWRVDGLYEDNDVSATRGKPRPGHQRLLADGRRDTSGCRGVALEAERRGGLRHRSVDLERSRRSEAHGRQMFMTSLE
jgi:hypothetical protein